MAKRLLRISAKSSDLNWVEFTETDDKGNEVTNIEHDGYLPDINGVCSGDYVNITIDLDTKQVVGMADFTSEEMKTAFENM